MSNSKRIAQAINLVLVTVTDGGRRVRRTGTWCRGGRGGRGVELAVRLLPAPVRALSA